MTHSCDHFLNGSAWLRADFHLHTCSDKEFTYAEQPNCSFAKMFIDKLNEQNICVGVITNHNKFDFNQYQELKKRGINQGILILPGVELSVNDGAGGIHVLVVFSPEWLKEQQDDINKAIAGMFPGQRKVDYERECARSNYNLVQTVEQLDNYGKDYFLIFAHVEQDKGLWKEMFNRLDDWKKTEYEKVRKKTLGFQKVVTEDATKDVDIDGVVRKRPDRKKVKAKLGEYYPAEVEGSDPKQIEDIGKGNQCFVKIGCLSYEAVRFALVDYEGRVRKEPFQPSHSWITSANFTGGPLDGQKIEFSSELNTFIGIRGSGKSAMLEAIRYALELPLEEGFEDVLYKNELVNYALGSGGKIEVEAFDRYGQKYTVSRILNNRPDVLRGTERMAPGVSIRDTLLGKPLFFGQKELSSRTKDFERQLLERLFSENLREIRKRIDGKRLEVREALRNYMLMTNEAEAIREQKESLEDLLAKLKVFQEHGVDAKMQERTDYNTDYARLKEFLENVKTFLSAVEQVLAEHEDDLRNALDYKPKQPFSFWDGFKKQYGAFVDLLDVFKGNLLEMQSHSGGLSVLLKQYEAIMREKQEAFSEAERALTAELSRQGLSSMRPEEYILQKQKLDFIQKNLEILEKNQGRKEEKKLSLIIALQELSCLYQEEFQLIQKELDAINSHSQSLKISASFRGDRKTYYDYFTSIFRGSRMWTNTLKGIAEHYPDFIQMWLDLDKAKELAGDSRETFEKYFLDNIESLLLWQVPNKIGIEYKGKELSRHSLGQRASAIILFILNMEQHDIIFIDQPEDDLDNQTIYQDIIKTIRDRKPECQFIFATHNANIPVLGDSEQVFVCDSEDDRLAAHSGSIDEPTIQTDVVNIMEGGQEAFDKRKEIYSKWKEQK